MPILIGARNLANAQAVAADLGAQAQSVDVRDPRSLDNFCARCSVVVNCAGPVCELQDLMAQAALRTRSHYVDLAGLTFVRERMTPHHQELVDRGLSCVVSAGWLPGMTELLPAYALARAKSAMDAVESVTIHFGDSGRWSENALRDAAWYLRQFGRQRPRYTLHGEWVRAKMSEVLIEQDIGPPIGRCLFSISSLPEMTELISRLQGCDARAYAYLPRRYTALVGSLIALLPLPRDLALARLRSALLAPSLPVGGFIVAQIRGRNGARALSQRQQMTFERGREYWTNAVVAATVARLISKGSGPKPGVNFLVDAVDPVMFMEELRKAGVTPTQSSEETQG